MNALGREFGVTLVELITALIVIGVVASMAAAMFGSTLQAYLVGYEAADDATEAQYALERMTRELRTIRSPSTADLTPAASQISFVEQSTGSVIGYSLSNGTLYRTVTPSGTPLVLAGNVSALSFDYLTADGRVALTSPSAAVALIYYIHAQLSVVSENITQGYTTTVRPLAF